jgi:hypothetical protein
MRHATVKEIKAGHLFGNEDAEQEHRESQKGVTTVDEVLRM